GGRRRRCEGRGGPSRGARGRPGPVAGQGRPRCRAAPDRPRRPLGRAAARARDTRHAPRRGSEGRRRRSAPDHPPPGALALPGRRPGTPAALPCLTGQDVDPIIRRTLMKKRLLAVAVLVSFMTAQVVSAATLAVTGETQKNVMVSIYNGTLGRVKDVREVRLPAGTHEAQFTDVAAQIDPTSVHLKSLSDPTGLRILEQNYEYDLLSSDKLLE